MENMLFYAHSGLRYLVLLVGIVAVLYFLYAAATKKGEDRGGRILGSIYTGVLDLQIVLGLLMVVFGTFYPALIGHLVMMIVAAVVAHVCMVLARSPNHAARAATIRLVGVVVSLALIVGGVMSIGRSLFESGAPTVM